MLWKKVNSTPIVPECFEPIEIYECEKAVILENNTAISPALCIYKNYKGQYVVAVYAPKNSYKQLGIKNTAKTFNSLDEARRYAANYMNTHPRLRGLLCSVVLFVKR